MNDKDKPSVTPPRNEPTVDSLALRGARIALGMLPGGAIMGEILTALYEYPYAKRQQRFFAQLADDLEELRNRKNITIEDLANDEEFLTTLHRATSAAMKAHQLEKLDALRFAVRNTAEGLAPEIDTRMLFLRLVDELTPTHLRILNLYSDPVRHLRQSGAWSSLPRNYDLQRQVIAQIGLPEIGGKPHIWHAYARHLYNEGLLNDLFNGGTAPFHAALQPFTTALGDAFLEFIAEEPANRAPAEDPDTIYDVTASDRQLVEMGKRLQTLMAELRLRLNRRRPNLALDAQEIRRARLRGVPETSATEAVAFRVESQNRMRFVDIELSSLEGALFEVFTNEGGLHRLSASFNTQLSFRDGYALNNETYDSPAAMADGLLAFVDEQIKT
jgi:hypothetical protein